MDDLWKFLGMNIPVGIALLIMGRMFLTHIENERAKERQTMVSALENNTAAMQAHTLEMQAQGAILRALVQTLERHDELSRTYIQQQLGIREIEG